MLHVMRSTSKFSDAAYIVTREERSEVATLRGNRSCLMGLLWSSLIGLPRR